MDLKSKGRTWVGNIYHKFEAICQEVDDFVNKVFIPFLFLFVIPNFYDCFNLKIIIIIWLINDGLLGILGLKSVFTCLSLILILLVPLFHVRHMIIYLEFSLIIELLAFTGYQ